ncbi:hypothetical protein DA2_0435 [Desulfovibrio sp. A2]|nr:hypothetical protein DA2_0435 [Desulfovibrio sp. A2]
MRAVARAGFRHVLEVIRRLQRPRLHEGADDQAEDSGFTEALDGF